MMDGEMKYLKIIVKKENLCMLISDYEGKKTVALNRDQIAQLRQFLICADSMDGFTGTAKFITEKNG